MATSLRQTAVLLPSEDPAEYAALLDSLRASYDLRDFTEERFVREMADAEWNLRRTRRHINQLYRFKYAEIAKNNPDFTPERVEFEMMQTLHAAGSPLLAFERYETKYERQYRHAHEGLRRYSADRRRILNRLPAAPIVHTSNKLPDEPKIAPRDAVKQVTVAEPHYQAALQALHFPVHNRPLR